MPYVVSEGRTVRLCLDINVLFHGFPEQAERSSSSVLLRVARLRPGTGISRGGTVRPFDEFEEDRHFLLTAMAGRADILVTQNLRHFRRSKAVMFERDDMFVIANAAHRLVVGDPHFAAYWLRQGVVPDSNMVASKPYEFHPLTKDPGTPEP